MPEAAALIGADLTSDVIVERKGALGIIRLNRPKALNSLSLEMIRAINATLDVFARDPAVGLVLIEGAGERGLCAGGDIRAIYNSARAADPAAELFFREEYVLNAKVARFPKPYVAFMDGIVMGGGVGVSAHGSHRVVTERTCLAMPEVGIGFVPDVGGTWLLSHAPGESGIYLGLTGETCAPSDAIYVGMADAFVISGQLSELRAALAALRGSISNKHVRETITQFAQRPDTGILEKNQHVIDSTMGGNRAEHILSALERNGSDFALATAKTIATRSPTSVKLTLRLLRLGRQAPDLESCLINEYRVVTSVLAGHDFIEGVRAAVIDKDRQPRWKPDSLANVEEDTIAYFLLPKANELRFPNREA